LRNTYLSGRFFLLLTSIIIWFCFSFFLPKIYWTGIVILIVLCAITLLDWILQFSKKNMISAERKMTTMLSMGDENKIEILVQNHSKLNWKIEIIDELPFQFQIRDFLIKCRLKPFDNTSITYQLRPVTRGE